jgi:hypothetical protein
MAMVEPAKTFTAYPRGNPKSCCLRASDHQITACAYQRAFMRCTVVACQTAERPDGVVTPRSVRNLAKDLADASGDMSQSSMNCFIFFAVSVALAFLPSAAFKQSSRVPVRRMNFVLSSLLYAPST